VTAARRTTWSRVNDLLRAGAAACALVAALSSTALAQSPLDGADVPPGTKMLLTSDQLVYNDTAQIVIATGAVQIDYGDYNLVADRVEYDRRTGRVRAIGNVEMIEPSGNRIYADDLDVTDNFADGFVNDLKVETPDNTRIVAESAERRGGEETRFNSGVYTACEPCKDNPEKAPTWQVKAAEVVQDRRTKTIKMRHARIEFFGMPLVYLPYLEVPDHDKKRKSGFLTPSAGIDDKLGTWLRVPYFLTLGPSADATVSVTGYTNQGFLISTEFRKAFENGNVMLRMAGISQNDPNRFDARTVDSLETQRGLIGTAGHFKINPRWTFGWKAMIETDPNFARTYGIEGFDDTRQQSNIYLTGLGTRSYFDLHAYRFDIRRPEVTAGGEYVARIQEEQEAFVHPVLDYNKIFSQPVLGGELSLDVNGQAISRRRTYMPVAGLYKGLEGHNERLTAELEWKRTFTTDFGLLLTPLLAARGDFHSYKTSTAVAAPAALTPDNSVDRGMVTAGLEASYPILITTAGSSHVIEPIAQIYARPDERFAGGLPNEDAQSFVFDATSLFERDKFSGYDRIEGGTRANVGIRYTGTFENGITTQAIFGQSYHLAGLNSFSVRDLTGAGADSGLEEDVSDFVGAAAITFPFGLSLATSARLDKDDLEIKRGDVTASLATGFLTTSLNYTEIAGQTGYGSPTDRRGVTGGATLRFGDNWSVFGSSGYDLVKKRRDTTRFGASYIDECLELSVFYERKPDDTNDAKKWSVGARLTLRTLGSIGYSSGEGASF
jgi:Organic solvent tolerance protein OstA